MRPHERQCGRPISQLSNAFGSLAKRAKATRNAITQSHAQVPYLDTLTIVFVVVLVISNLVGPKMCQVGPLKLSGAELLFPITYIFGDVFTEVYGYAASRRAIWMGFLAMGLLSVFGAIAVALPPAPDWHNQQAFATVFGLVPRFAIASLVAYWAGEFTNSYTMAKLKLVDQRLEAVDAHDWFDTDGTGGRHNNRDHDRLLRLAVVGKENSDILVVFGEGCVRGTGDATDLRRGVWAQEIGARGHL